MVGNQASQLVSELPMPYTAGRFGAPLWRVLGLGAVLKAVLSVS